LNLARRLEFATAGVGALLVLVASCAGCARQHGASFPRAVAEAERAETAGRYAEAATRYDAAANVATLARDRDHARYLAGMMMVRDGNVRDGVVRLDEIANASPPTEHSAEAAYRAASIRSDSTDPKEAELGMRAMEQVMFRFPTHGIAHSALRRFLLDKDAKEGKRASLDYLERLANGPLGAGELGEIIAYQAAERMAELDETARAHDAFLAVATKWPYPFGALWDNSLYRASEMDEKLTRYAHAIVDLERMVGERETTSLVGSYTRPKMSAGLFRIGMLYGFRLHDRARGRDAFHRLQSEFATSKLRPDALWFEARLWADDGDAKTACDRLATLARDFPDSRYVPCAIEKCPALKRAEKSRAPKECHAYIGREDREPPH
jgi:outer membrane protein assembly factor BamD (BamD/ComL family)